MLPPRGSWLRRDARIPTSHDNAVTARRGQPIQPGQTIVQQPYNEQPPVWPTYGPRSLRHCGVETRQVWALTAEGETRNRRGVVREDVAAAVAERDDTDEPG